MRPKFLLDEHLSPEVAAQAGKAGVDVLAVARSELDDAALFRKAIEAGRILVTYTIDDMSILLGNLLKEGVEVPGVVFVDLRTIPPSDVAGLARALVKLAKRMEKGEIDAGGGIFLQR